MLASLTDPEEFRRRRAREWTRAHSYWVSEPLRHVSDVGHVVTDRVMALLADAPSPVSVTDAACGSAWLLSALREQGCSAPYLGVDVDPKFVAHTLRLGGDEGSVSAIIADLELSDFRDTLSAPVVVSAFTLFELADLESAARNLAHLVRADGTLLVVTIDKTYLMLAASNGDWDEFISILKEYALLPGRKYFFQQIDLGHAASPDLSYASVLYSTEDYISAFANAGLSLSRYSEIAATDRPIPKIYQFLEFRHRQQMTLEIQRIAGVEGVNGS